MGDWNTLHFFDFDKFQMEVVPQLTNLEYLQTIVESQIFKYHRRFPNEQELLKLIDFIKKFDDDFRTHPLMFDKDIYSRKNDESHYTKDQRVWKHQEEYQAKFINEIDLLSIIIQVKCFENCAFYNPHFILGRRIFTGAVLCKPKSIAEEICYRIMEQELLFYNDNLNQIINWVSNEELQLLYLDIENIQAKEESQQNYINGFKNFIQIAYENKLGFISLSNFREELIKMVVNDRTLNINPKLINKTQSIIEG